MYVQAMLSNFERNDFTHKRFLQAKEKRLKIILIVNGKILKVLTHPMEIIINKRIRNGDKIVFHR